MITIDLSRNVIKRYVAVTTPEKVTSPNDTVNGTVVSGDGGVLYVQIDGSSILTPVSSTIDIRENDRVLVLLKNHEATVLGSPTSPTARMEELENLGGEITRMDTLIAGKAGVGELVALEATIGELQADNVNINNKLTANEGKFEALEAEDVKINGKLTAYDASIEKLQTDKIDATEVDAKYATIENLNAVNAEINNLDATYATIDQLNATNAEIDNLDATYATIVQLDAEKARITDLEATRLTADSAEITNLQADVAEIDTLIFGAASGTTIQTSFANAVIAQLGNAQIKSAMIDSLSADKITAGDIVTNNVRVLSEDGKLLISDETIQISDDTRVRVQIGKDASNDYSINVWDASGKLMFSQGGITDAAIKNAIIRDDMVSENANIKASKLDISSLFSEINGSTETINSNKVLIDTDAGTLDVAFVKMESDINDISNDVTTQGTAISVIQGQISSKIWMDDITTIDLSEIEGSITTLETQYSELDQTVDGISLTVGQHTAQIANKADSSTVTAVSDRVTEVEADLSGFRTSVSETYATKTDLNQKADDYTIGLYNGTGGNPKPVRFATVNYSTCNSENGVCVKISMVSGHGNGTSYAFLQDATIRINHVGTVEVDNVKHYGANAGTYDGAVRQYGDIFWVIDTENKVVDFYCLMGQYARVYQTPWKRLTYSSGGTVTQYTSCTVYSSGTKVWANNSDIALMTDVTNLETKITQTADAIALSATKTELTVVSNAANAAQDTADGVKTNLANNYYTKTQTDAQIKVSADAITSTVSALESNLESNYATKSEVSQTATSIISRVEDVEGDISTLEQTATSLTSRIGTAEGDISTLEQTATNLTSRIGTAEGDISTLEQTATNLTSRIGTAEGDISTLEQTSGSLTSRIGTAEGKISTLEQTASGFSISLGNLEDDVETAQSTANTAKTNAATAQSTADTAKTNAATAQSTADTAKANAATAQSTANTARTEAANAKKEATNYLSYDSTNGLLVGNKSSGSWSGFRTQITSSAFNILNSAGTVLASYGAKLIELGKNATDAVISLCNGAGTITAFNTANASEGIVMMGGSDNIPQLTLTNQGAFLQASNSEGASSTNEISCFNTGVGTQLFSNEKIDMQVNGGNIEFETYDGGNIVFCVGSGSSNHSSWTPYHRDSDTMTVSDCRTAGFVTNSSKDVYFMVSLTKPVISGTTSAVSMSVSNVKLQLRQNGYYTHGTSSAITPSSATARYVPGVGIHMKCTMSATTNATNNAPVGVDFDGTFTF